MMTATGVPGDLQKLTLSETAMASNAEDTPAPATKSNKAEPGSSTAADDEAAHADDAAGEGNDSPPPAEKKKKFLLQLPREEIDRVLSWKRCHLSPNVVSAENIAAFDAISDGIEAYQTWMRGELERNGGNAVMVDDEFVARREESLKMWEEEVVAPVEWDESELAYWNIVNDDLSDDDEYQDDEEDVQEETGTN